MLVQKRDGTLQLFDPSKIKQAVLKAFIAVDGEPTEYAIEKANNIAAYIEQKAKSSTDKYYTVEEIQDLVESGLMSNKRKDVARAYIIYRNNRNEARGNLTDKTFLDFLSGESEYWNTENSNKNAKVVTTQRDYLAGIASTDLARRFLLPKDVCEAHDAGIIHQHDMDYMAQRALTNCCLINLDDMLSNGTVINGVTIDPQHRLSTATTVATQIIIAVASSQYGGSTITLSHLAPYVRLSFGEHYFNGLKYISKIPALEIDYEIKYMLDNMKDQHIDNPEWEAYNYLAYEYAIDMLKKEIRDSVQTFNYQINSMSTTNGQTPFISVSMDINEESEYKIETAMLIEEFLKQRIKGMKNEKGIYVTQTFPKLLYILDENNIEEDTPYFYLTELAAKCTAKRMVPDYISAKKMREYKISPITGSGSVYACMGKRKLQLM